MCAHHRPLALLLAAMLGAGVCALAQSAPADLPDAPASQSMVSDPAAPSADVGGASAAAVAPSQAEQSRPFLHRVVPAGEGPQPLTAPQKFEMSFRSRVAFGAVGSSIFGAGERQLFNSRPHYGTDSGAFGERLGAAELKQVTESFFSYGLYAAAFHEDPHYYVMGSGHSIVHRAVYSATRIALTRTDDGGASVNWAKLAGMGSATALTNAYYPPQDRGVRQSLSAYGSSLATSMLTLELHEFVPDLMRAVRHRKSSN
jgi:hypothetical protein